MKLLDLSITPQTETVVRWGGKIDRELHFYVVSWTTQEDGYIPIDRMWKSSCLVDAQRIVDKVLESCE